MLQNPGRQLGVPGGETGAEGHTFAKPGLRAQTSTMTSLVDYVIVRKSRFGHRWPLQPTFSSLSQAVAATFIAARPKSEHSGLLKRPFKRFKHPLAPQANLSRAFILPPLSDKSRPVETRRAYHGFLKLYCSQSFCQHLQPRLQAPGPRAPAAAGCPLSGWAPAPFVGAA